MHSLSLLQAYEHREELEVADWKASVAADTIHVCQNPFKPMRTIIHGSEIKRQSLLWRIVEGKYVLRDEDALALAVPNQKQREEIFSRHLSECLLRRITVKEQAVFQGLSFLTFPPEYSKTTIHGMIGNAFPPRLASCIYHTVEEVLIDSGTPWKNRTTVDLFSGVGGMSMGTDYSDSWTAPTVGGRGTRRRGGQERGGDGRRLELSPLGGFEHLLLADINEDCYNMLRSVELNEGFYNWSADRVRCTDARLVDYTPFWEKVGILCGGPPCQPFSQAGKKLGFDDSRDGWDICVKALCQTGAETFVFENVKGIFTAGKGKTGGPRCCADRVVNMLSNPWKYYSGPLRGTEEGAGAGRWFGRGEYPYRWHVSHTLVKCSDYGVPQQRDRVLFVGYRVAAGVAVVYGAPVTRTEQYMRRYEKPDRRGAWEVIVTHALENDADHGCLCRNPDARCKCSTSLWRTVPKQYTAIVK
jgi:site-specific DNA-cytosine methylase